jgi:hypothetical protein
MAAGGNAHIASNARASRGLEFRFPLKAKAAAFRLLLFLFPSSPVASGEDGGQKNGRHPQIPALVRMATVKMPDQVRHDGDN